MSAPVRPDRLRRASRFHALRMAVKVLFLLALSVIPVPLVASVAAILGPRKRADVTQTRRPEGD